MQEPGKAERKLTIPYFEGLNSTVSFTVAKKTECFHMENARSSIIGTLEKRRGQTVLGTASTSGDPFITTGNYALFDFDNDGSNNQGLYRISETYSTSTLSVSVFDEVFLDDIVGFASPLPITIHVSDSIDIGEQVNDGGGGLSTIYYLNDSDVWTALSGKGTNIPGAQFTYTFAEQCTFLSNYISPNRYIQADGLTVVDSATATGHLYNSPQASIVNFYKDRLYLADFKRDNVRYKTSVLRSSYPMGIIALVNEDVEAREFSRIAYDARSGGAGVKTGTHVCGGDDRALIVWVTASATADMGATYNGIAMTQVGTEVQMGAANNYLWTFLLINPSEGSNTVEITGSSTAGNTTWQSLSYKNVRQADQVNSTQPDVSDTGYSASGGSISNSITTLTDRCWIIAAATADSNWNYDGVGDSNFTNRGNSNSFMTGDSGAAYPDGVPIGAISQTIGTQGTATDIVISQIALKPASLESPVKIPVTDTKYFYTVTGAKEYEVYRGPNKIATLYVEGIQELTITVATTGGQVANTGITFTTGYDSLLASDEIWISGTFNGSKIIRWINNPTSFGQDVKQYDTFKLSGADNDAVTMMTNVGNVMLIANKNNMASWNDYVLENFDLNIGCTSKKGFVKLLGSLYFMHYSGVYSTSGGVPKLLSSKIERYINGATREGKEVSAAGKKGRSVFFTLGDVTLYNPDGSIEKTMRDVCIEYNLTQENWYVHTNVKATEFATFIEESDSDRLILTDDSGNMATKEFLVGNTDDGDRIFYRIDTNKLTLNPDYENVNNPISLIFESERGSEMQAYVSLDDDEFYQVNGTIQKGLSILKINGKAPDRGDPPVCRLIKISIRDSSIQTCKLTRMSLVYLPSTADDTNE